MQKLNIQWAKDHGACNGAIKWIENNHPGKELDFKDVINGLIGADKTKWANWTVTRLLDHKQQVQYAVFAAEQVISMHEKQYTDDRPRKAINAAKNWIENPCEETRTAAYAAYAAYAADAAAGAADTAADAAAYAAYAAGTAAGAAPGAAAYAAYAAAYAAADRKEMLVKIINYGVSLL